MTNPATPPKSGMPRWLIVLLVIFLVIILGCCGGFVACNWMCSRVAQTGGNTLQSLANAATQRAEAEMKAATQRAMEEARRQGAEFDTTGAGLALPAEFPADIPIYSGFKVTTRVVPPGSKGGTLLLEGPAKAATLGSYYEKEMAAQGWKQIQAFASGNSFSQSYTKDDRSATFTGTENDGSTTLQVIFGAK
jgi:hypothetical protein